MTGTATTANTAPAATQTSAPATTANPAATTAPAGTTAATADPAPAAETADPRQTFADSYNATAGKQDSATDAAQAPAGKEPGTSEDGQASDGKKPDEQVKDPAAEGQTEEGSEQNAQAYEQFTLPEGVELNAVALEKATPILQKYNMPQEDAQALVDIAAEMVSKGTQDATAAHEKLVSEWHDQTVEQYGKEGEAQFKEKAGLANSALKKFFSPQEMGLLDAYGIGNLPGLFGLALHVGTMMKEDGNVLSGNGTGGAGEKTLADTWYPDEPKK